MAAGCFFMNDFATHARAMQQVQDRLAGDCPVISWNGDDYKLIPGSASRRADLAPGGFQLNADFQCDALVATFIDGDTVTDAESLKDALLQRRIAYQGDFYKVDSVRILPGALQVRIECSSLGQNA